MASNLIDAFSLEELTARLGEGLEVSGEGVSRTLVVPKERLLTVMSKLAKDTDFCFDYLSDVTAVDRSEAGYEVVYQLFSIDKKVELMVKTKTEREPAQVPTVSDIWPGANWMEREVYDLMGITFTGHPNMTRMFLPEEFEGHPLQKTFKLQPRALGWGR